MKNRQKFTSTFKAKVALELLSGNKTMAEICSEYKIHPTQAGKWKKEAQSILEVGFEDKGVDKQLTELKQQNDELFRQLGELRYESEWLKKNINCLVSDKRVGVETNEPRLSIARQCDLLQLNRSSYYYHKVVNQEDEEYMELIDNIYTEFPFYGSRNIADEIAVILGKPCNRKRIQRLMRLMGIQAVVPKPYTSQGNKSHEIYPYLLKDVAINRPNHVWASDITYIRMSRGFLYLVAVLDWYSRYVLSWRLSSTLEADFCIDALRMSLENSKPKIFNTDQGSQFTSHEHVNLLKENEIEISMDGKGRCFDNIMVERLWRTIKYEEVYLKEYNNGKEAEASLGEYIKFYNERRRHSALGKLTPAGVYFS